MCEQYRIAFVTLRKFIARKKRKGEVFSIWELERHVKEKAKTTKIAPGRDVRDWIEDAKVRGRIIEIAPFRYLVI